MGNQEDNSTPLDSELTDSQPAAISSSTRNFVGPSRALRVFSFIGLLAVLAAIFVPKFVRARAGGLLTACKSNLKNIGDATEWYAAEHDGKCPTSMVELTPKYIKMLPTCPASEGRSYSLSVGPNAPFSDGRTKYYYVACVGENHTADNVTGDFPAYNRIQGLIERSP